MRKSGAKSKISDQTICALKIRRLDANRCSMEREAELHKIAKRSRTEDFWKFQKHHYNGVYRWIEHN